MHLFALIFLLVGPSAHAYSLAQASVAAVTEPGIIPDEFPMAIVDDAEPVLAMNFSQPLLVAGPMEFSLNIERGLGDWIQGVDRYTHVGFACQLHIH